MYFCWWNKYKNSAVVSYPLVPVDIDTASFCSNVPVSVHRSTDYQLIQTEGEENKKYYFTDVQELYMKKTGLKQAWFIRKLYSVNWILVRKQALFSEKTR